MTFIYTNNTIIIIYTNNTIIIKLSANLIFHERSKHIEINYHSIYKALGDLIISLLFTRLSVTMLYLLLMSAHSFNLPIYNAYFKVYN